MFGLLHRPETSGFRLLRAVGSTISLFGLVLIGLAVVLVVVQIAFDPMIGFGTMQIGFLMLWLFLVGIGVVALGQLMHLAVAIWRALDRKG